MPVRRATHIALVVLFPSLVTLGFFATEGIARFALPALALLLVGAWIGLRHPLVFYWALAFSLGAVPFGSLPGVHLPLVFTFSVAVIFAALLHPTAVGKVTALELTVVLLFLTSTLSLVATGSTTTDLMEYMKWSVATLVVFALLRLPRHQLRRFGQIFVVGTTLAAMFAVVIRAADPTGRMITVLAPIGYGKAAEGSRFVYTPGGTETVRLAGTFVDPNAAGIILFVALLVCFVVIGHRIRWVMAGVLFVAIVLTLSRAALFSFIGGVVLVLAFHQLRKSQRLAIVGAFMAAALAAFAVPSVRNRVFSSFSGNDAGSSARGDALRDFPGLMAGHWPFGLGWGRKEFVDEAAAFQVNYVANAPLLTIYRGGFIAGLAFLAVMIVGIVMSYQCVRSRRWEYGLFGGGFIAFCLIALQLDFPVVTIPSVTTAFSVLLVFLVVTWELATGRTTAARGSRSETLPVAATTTTVRSARAPLN
ncbi:O-antigen ligase family protein [Williamsia sterculiae]|uniref:O-antigen ligase-related domain-containing protein n=1 Tax=Williamsia sterculiae TaxID=1344003 RepID=A0A1N7CZQ7_9NOCA|nr:O-antigen ligase family protein [Williamsia sterculiae]SIR69069.1 hypothetical protein SAMN05445060_0469 [Williamsia sterculiae]